MEHYSLCERHTLKQNPSDRANDVVDGSYSPLFLFIQPAILWDPDVHSRDPNTASHSHVEKGLKAVKSLPSSDVITITPWDSSQNGCEKSTTYSNKIL